jgi:aspartate aminotransferase
MFDEAEELKRKHGVDQVIDLSLGNPILEPPNEFLASLKEAVLHAPKGSHKYMSNAGYESTRAAVARALSKEHDLTMDSSQIVMSCGAAAAINVVLKALLDPGDEVIILAPYFVEYIFYIENHGGIPRIIESSDTFQPVAERLRSAVTKNTKVVLLNNPNNPTGVVYPRPVISEVAAVLREAEKRYSRSIYLVSDEVYRHITYDGITVPSVFHEYESSIIVSSFAKDLGLAGERIGYVAISPHLDSGQELMIACTIATRILGFVNAPALMQRSICNCLHARVDLGLYENNRRVLCEALSASGFEYVKPEGAFYLFPRCPEGDDVLFCQRLKEKLLIAVPGRGFGRSGYFRLSYSVEHETAVRAADRIRSL